MKSQVQYECTACGAKVPQMLGRCPVCGEWGTIEETVAPSAAATKNTVAGRSGKRNVPMRLQEVSVQADPRIDMHCGELNRVLGGGLVSGSLVLLGGEPGIGKSTLALQVLMQMGDRKTFYASGEESVRQLKLRAERLAGNPDNLYIVAETSLENILQSVTEVQPDIVVVDSIQTIGTEAGSICRFTDSGARVCGTPATVRQRNEYTLYHRWAHHQGRYLGGP